MATLSVTEMLAQQFEPHAKRRFVLAIEGIDAYIIKTAARPKVTIAETPIHYINSMRYVAGRASWDKMAVTLHDPIAPSGAQQVMEWIRLHFESVSGRAGYADFYKRDIQIKMLDPVGTVVQLWDIKGAMLGEVDFGGLEYQSEADAAEITLSIRFDNAVLVF